ncbi:MAG: DUF932 domain-containing protein [Bryobacteraceae bacterium]|jgi:hypothetical protein
MPEVTLLANQGKLTREELALVPTPLGTATHRPVPHIDVVNALVETLGFRHVGVLKEEYAVDRTGNKMFGVMELDQGMDGARFALGIRNSHDKSFRLAITVGYRVFVCENLAFHGDYNPVLAKHSKHLSLQNVLSVGVDNMQRNFTPMVEAVERWRTSQLSDVSAKLLIYEAFIEGALEVPHHLDRRVHDLYFNPTVEEFQPRTLWSLSNAFTSAFKELDPIPQYRATGKLAGFLERA